MTTARVAFADTDASGRVHFARLLRYFEVGEREALRELGILRSPYTRDAGKRVQEVDQGGLDFPRVRVTCDYRAAAWADDLLQIRTSIDRVGRTSLTWGVKVLRGSEIVAEGSMVTVCMDEKAGKPRPLPDWFRRPLES